MVITRSMAAKQLDDLTYEEVNKYNLQKTLDKFNPNKNTKVLYGVMILSVIMFYLKYFKFDI